MKVKLLEPLQGFEDVAEYRRPLKGEWSTDDEGNVEQSDGTLVMPWLVLKPIKQWRPATVEDGVQAIRGKKIVARFRDWSTMPWREGELATVWPEPSETRWGKRGCCSYLFCEVLDD